MSQIGQPRRIITVEPVFEPVPQRSQPDVPDVAEHPKSVPERVEEPKTVPARS